MPIFEYICQRCKYEFEVLRLPGRVYPDVLCPICGDDDCTKKISNVYVHYKGAGFKTTEARGITGSKRRPNIKVGLKSDLPFSEQERIECQN